MSPPTNRRTVLITAGVAAVAVAAAPVVAQAADIRGTITFENGEKIPPGSLFVYLDDRAIADSATRRAAGTHLESDGRATSIAFSLPAPVSATASPSPRIVARLERPDGWLLARGSATAEAGTPVGIALSKVMY